MKPGRLVQNSQTPKNPAPEPEAVPFPAPIEPVTAIDLIFRVLLLEADDNQDTLLAETVRAEIPDSDIMRTGGPLGALALGQIHDFDLLIVNAPMPPDLILELVAGFQERNPRSEIILAVPNPSEHLDHGPGVHAIELPINPLEMIELLRGCRDRVLGATQMPASVAGEIRETPENQFVVVLHGHTPMDVVQIKCLAGASTALDFIRRKGPGGRVWFEKGEIVHAETGLLTGEAALTEMMCWPGGSIVEVDVPPAKTQTINVPWSHLLMNIAHAADERKAGAEAVGAAV
jgi:hypothetical protein